MPDDIHKAIAFAKEGRMNPENFKKIMPDMASLFRGNFDRSISTPFFDRIYAITESQLKHPHLMKEELIFKPDGAPQPVEKDLRYILSFLSVLTGIDNAIYQTASYQKRFFVSYLANVEQKCDIFPIGGHVINDIFYSAYVKTAYEFEEEIVEASNKTLLEVCSKINDREAFAKGLIAKLGDTVTLPCGVETIEELIEHASEYFRARAVTNAFVKTVRVLKEFPDYYQCLQCWVCKKDGTKNCSICHVAAFCCRKCQAKAWKKNHKVLCLHYKRTMDYAKMQCMRINRALQESFIAPGRSLLQPNQFFDFTMVACVSAFVAQDIGGSLLEEKASIDIFYRNLVKVDKDRKAFRTLFKKGDELQSGDTPLKSLIDVCTGLMYNGNPPGETLPGTKVITRNTFLREYKNLTGYVKQSEEMARASVIEDLMRLYQGEDFSQYPKEAIQALCDDVKGCTT